MMKKIISKTFLSVFLFAFTLVLMFFVNSSVYAEGGAVVSEDLTESFRKNNATKTSGIGIYNTSQPIKWYYYLYGKFEYEDFKGDKPVCNVGLSNAILIASGSERFKDSNGDGSVDANYMNKFVPADLIRNTTKSNDKIANLDISNLLLTTSDSKSLTAAKIIRILEKKAGLNMKQFEPGGADEMLRKIANEQVYYEFDMHTCVCIETKLNIPGTVNYSIAGVNVPMTHAARLTLQNYSSGGVSKYYDFSGSNNTLKTGEKYKSEPYYKYIDASLSRIYGVVKYTASAQKMLQDYYLEISGGYYKPKIFNDIYLDENGTMVNPLREQIKKSEKQDIKGKGENKVVEVTFYSPQGNKITTITLNSNTSIKGTPAALTKFRSEVLDWATSKGFVHEVRYKTKDKGIFTDKDALIEKKFTKNEAYILVPMIKITFDPNGGTVNGAERLINYNSSVTLSKASKSDRTTSTWTKKKNNLTTKVTASDVYTKDTTLYAYWDEITTNCNVKFWSNESQTETPYYSTVVKKGETVGTSMPKNPTKSGKIFQGWYTREEYGGKTTLFSAETEIVKDTDVYASWGNPGDVVWQVTYIIDGKAYSERNVRDGFKVGAHPTSPTKKGMQFVDWYTTKSYTTTFSPETVIKKRTYVYGKMIEAPDGDYTITYMAKTSSNSYSVYKTLTTRKNIKVDENPGNAPDGGKFMYWTYTEGADDKVNEKDIITESTTIYAKYTDAAYNGDPYITFDYGSCEWRNTPFTDTARLTFPVDYLKGTVWYKDNKCPCHNYGCYSRAASFDCTIYSYGAACKSYTEPYGTVRTCRGAHSQACRNAYAEDHKCPTCGGSGGQTCGASLSRYYSCSACGATVSAGGGSSHNSSSHKKGATGSFSYAYSSCSRGHLGSGSTCTSIITCNGCGGSGYPACKPSCEGRFPSTCTTPFTCDVCGYNDKNTTSYTCPDHGAYCVGIHVHYEKDSRSVHYMPSTSSVTNASALYSGSETITYSVATEGKIVVNADFKFKENPARIQNPIEFTGAYANYEIQKYTIPYSDGHRDKDSQVYKLDFTNPYIDNATKSMGNDWQNTDRSYSIIAKDNLSGLRTVEVYERTDYNNNLVHSKVIVPDEVKEYSDYSGVLTQSGTYKITLNMTDYAGNQTSDVQAEYKIDKIAPVVKYVIPKDVAVYNPGNGSGIPFREGEPARERYEIMSRKAKFLLNVVDTGRPDQISGIVDVKYKVAGPSSWVATTSGKNLLYDSDVITCTQDQINRMNAGNYLEIEIPDAYRYRAGEVCLAIYARDKAGNETYTNATFNTKDYKEKGEGYVGPSSALLEPVDGVTTREIPSGYMFLLDVDREKGIYAISKIYDIKWRTSIGYPLVKVGSNFVEFTDNGKEIRVNEFPVYRNEVNDTIGLGYRVDLKVNSRGYNSENGDTTKVVFNLYGAQGTTYKKLMIFERDANGINRDITSQIEEKYEFVKTEENAHYSGDGTDIKLGEAAFCGLSDWSTIYFNFYLPASVTFKYADTGADFKGSEVLLVAQLSMRKWMDTNNKAVYVQKEDNQTKWIEDALIAKANNSGVMPDVVRTRYGYLKAIPSLDNGRGQLLWFDVNLNAIKDISGGRR